MMVGLVPIRNVFINISFINMTGFKNSDASANSISDNAANDATEMEGENSASAQSLVNLTKITCNCKTKCTSNRCVCHKASVSCSFNCNPCNGKCDNFN